MRRPAILFLLSFLLIFPSAALAEKLRKPQINRVEISRDTGEIYIEGEKFGVENELSVSFGGSALSLVSRSEEYLIANLPENSTPGTYRLEVELKKKRRTKSSSLAVVVFPIVEQPEPAPTLPNEISILNGLVGINNLLPQAQLDVAGDLAADEIGGSWDSSSEGFVRLGNLQIAFGSFGSDSNPNNYARTELPAPFLSNNYSIALTPAFPVRFANVIYQDANGFQAQTYGHDGFFSGAGGWFIAIGLWRAE